MQVRKTKTKINRKEEGGNENKYGKRKRNNENKYRKRERDNENKKQETGTGGTDSKAGMLYRG